MKTSWMIPLALVGLASCSQPLTPDSKREAQERWSAVRSQLKCQLAADAFKSGHLDDAQRHLQESLQLDPELPEAHVLHARILLERGETASASDALDAGIRCGGDTAETDYLAGMIAQRYGDFENALAWYQRSSRREPMNAHYLASVAETLVALGRAAEALELVRSRWTDFEQNATLRALAGGIHMMLAQYEAAADAYRQAVRIAPEDTVMRSQLGVALAMAGSYQEAAGVLEPLVEESSGEAAQPSALIALGQAQLALHQPQKAKTMLARATAVESTNARAWALLAQASLGCNDHLTARRAATRAAQLEPGRVDYVVLLAYVCACQRDYAGATDLLEAVLREQPGDPLAAHLLARCRRSLGMSAAPQQSPRFEEGSPAPIEPPEPGRTARSP